MYLLHYFYRAIPEAAYIKLGTIKYGIKLSTPNLSSYPSNKSRFGSISSYSNSTNSHNSNYSNYSRNSRSSHNSLHSMSPTYSFNSKMSSVQPDASICGNGENCCCIGGSNLQKEFEKKTTKLPVPQTGKLFLIFFLNIPLNRSIN